MFVHITRHYIERVLDYQVGNLGLCQYLAKLNARKDSLAVIWMKPAFLINIW